MLCWESIYTGLPNRIRVDRGSCFGDEFFTAAVDAKIDVARFVIEDHSSLGAEKRLNQLLRNEFRKAKLRFDSYIPNSTVLAMCIRAKNDTLGPKGFVTSVLVFGTYPSTQVFE